MYVCMYNRRIIQINSNFTQIQHAGPAIDLASPVKKTTSHTCWGSATHL